ncbi:hypothetical protein [Peribacillus frigoritolerans]|uniref:hypothetical protein n=1 Tax=Peribacillus frigoritolerans TaxID=450367 RepID=UPI002079B233|nr:hypothetical protein [Peribacillus frigoritolerans]USK75918.1 hypothetical protein LIT31_04940 [Peribacillus frigoritolerans]
MDLKSTLQGNMKQGDVFIDKMDKVFASLRADFDVASAQFSKKKIEELNKVHVDATKKVSTLAVQAQESNGFIKGLRGTGKSHLLLLARDKINTGSKHICIYINLQEHLNIGGSVVVQERFYVWALLKQLKRQLMYIIDEQNEAESTITKMVKKVSKFFLVNEEKEQQDKLTSVFLKLEQLIRQGEDELEMFSLKKSAGQRSESTNSWGMGAEVDSKGKFKIKAQESESIKGMESLEVGYGAERILDIERLKTMLIEIVNILGINGITFFYDEWSMLDNKDQHTLSKLIRALSSSPLYHWVAYIPYKSSLGVLEQSADMPHNIDLDLQFIYEENNKVCMNYFIEFIDNRLKLVFESEVFKAAAFIRQNVMELMVKSSMGNTRDFGVMLNKAWNNYRQDYLVTEKNKVISKKHVQTAIKALAEEKQANLQAKNSSKYSERLWMEIIKFISEKKHTHFCIELSDKNVDLIKEEEFIDLLYHRLVHLRKKDYPAKDGGEDRLAIYSADVSVLFYQIFETRSDSKKIKLVTDSSTIHNQIRRYIFNIEGCINEFRMEQGKQIMCTNPECKKIITEEMKLAWENKMCIYCLTPFSKEDTPIRVKLA